ncbi:MAG: bifunctional UDP-N-acetylglucosamine diphosphorylase/glucosamine-1-phosphate N-acetyltransferase GlmU [Actinomycetota bacterium]|nr:bifunctional UDP-N-acetylglucosamine diphosphorylase/glucosamine-1-phosphate N-acetyltransferase GlmU [Actinomycetota bacterium]
MPEASSRSLAVVVLAAGLGKRLKSNLPKVLHPVCGRPALWHVLQAARRTRPARVVVVVHHGADLVREAVATWGIRPEPILIDQGEPLGTGHAVMVAEKAVGPATDVLTLSGDEPLHTPETLTALLGLRRRMKAAAALLTTVLPDASGYGRILRDGDELVRIVEERDATPQQREIHEVATMAYAFRREALFDALPAVGTDNRQHEYYLPDVISTLKEKGEPVGVAVADLGGVLGINTRAELAGVIAVMRRRINARHMADGVTMLDPERTYVDVDVRIGRDTLLYPLTILEGQTRIGEDCELGPSARILDSRIGAGSSVQYSVVRDSRIARGVSIGPFAHVRPGTVLADGAKAGSFVEIKASRVGPGSKVPHLSYIGDATIGRNTNIGAGTVTVNYDGWDKHPTVIGDEVKIGSDTMLVAPVKVGRRAMTGAGSVVTRDVPAGALAIERAEQRNVPGFRDRKEARKRAERRGRTKGSE